MMCARFRLVDEAYVLGEATDRTAGSALPKRCKPPSDPALHEYMELFPEELVDMVDCIVRADGEEFPAHAVV